MAKYDGLLGQPFSLSGSSTSNNGWPNNGLLGQPLLEVEEPDKENGVTLIFKDNRFMFIKLEDGKLSTISIPE